MRFESWGRYPKALNSRRFRYTDVFPKLSQKLLPFGNGRSYGDCCLISNGVYLESSNLDHIQLLDTTKMTITVESGVILKRLLRFLVHKNLFLPVVPGTQLVTVGGAVANDIHGKSHHVHGSFGNNVERLLLARSDGKFELTKSDDLFRATVGGIGLTGFIEWVELKLIKIPSGTIRQKVYPARSLKEIVEKLTDFSNAFTYTVAWIDLLQRAPCGLVMGGEFVEWPVLKRRSDLNLTFPLDARVVNRFSLKILNMFYHYIKGGKKESFVRYESFFFPLDVISHWNRAYGPAGFMQWQGVFPRDTKILEDIVSIIGGCGALPTLAVLKDFGTTLPVGFLSFPTSGLTLAIDFPVSNESFKAVDELNKLMTEIGGKVYLAKDSRLKPGEFQKMYPQFDRFIKHKDPMIESDMWRRLSVGLKKS